MGTQRLATFRDWTLSGIGNPPILLRVISSIGRPAGLGDFFRNWAIIRGWQPFHISSPCIIVRDWQLTQKLLFFSGIRNGCQCRNFVANPGIAKL